MLGFIDSLGNTVLNRLQVKALVDAGRLAYVLSFPTTMARPETVDIFSEAPSNATIATVAEQRAWFDKWITTPYALTGN